MSVTLFTKLLLKPTNINISLLINCILLYFIPYLCIMSLLWQDIIKLLLFTIYEINWQILLTIN